LSKNKTINLEEINKSLIRKKARLVLTIGDLCNNVIEGIREPITSTSGFDNHVEKNYKNLFLLAKGSVLISSSKPTESSIATGKGSIFTTSLIYNLKMDVDDRKKIATWENLLSKTSHTTNQLALEFNKSQHPIYKVDIHYLKDLSDDSLDGFESNNKILNKN
jgi:hypothetical protein